MGEADLGFDVAVPMVASLIARRAISAQIRVLGIKGPFLAAQRLRSSKISVDLDLLLAPSDVDRFVSHLEQDGWRRRDPEGIRLSIEPHSVTMVHPYWPCMVDVHLFWVGFLRPAPDVFDMLWARRDSVRIAGSTVSTLDVASAALLLALNELRSAPKHVLNERLEDISQRARNLLGASAPAEIEQAARIAGAEYTAGPLLERLGVVVSAPREIPPGLQDWMIRLEMGDQLTASWILLIRRSPWYRKPLVVLDALAIRPSALRAMRPEAPNGPLGYWSAWWSRLRKGLRHIRQARHELSTTDHEDRTGSEYRTGSE